MQRWLQRGQAFIQSQFPQCSFGFLQLLFRETAIWFHFRAQPQLEPTAGSESRGDLRVEIHPLLGWNLVRPNQAGEIELLGCLRSRGFRRLRWFADFDNLFGPAGMGRWLRVDAVGPDFLILVRQIFLTRNISSENSMSPVISGFWNRIGS